MRTWKFRCVSMALFLCVAASAYAQQPSEGWCKDTGTWCTDASQTRAFLAGVRFIGEPRLGFVFAKAGALNRLNVADFANFTLIGGETNLWRQVVSLQGLLITPGKATFDPLSPLVKDHRLINANGEIAIDSGFAIGASFFDGVVAFGVGRLNFDRREIVDPTDNETHSRFTYFNIQAISAVRAAIKATK